MHHQKLGSIKLGSDGTSPLAGAKLIGHLKGLQFALALTRPLRSSPLFSAHICGRSACC